MQVFLTGGTGFIGTVVVEYLLRAGHSVRGLARSKQSAEKLRAAGVEPVFGNLHSVDVLKDEAKRADAVIHLALVPDYDDLQKFLAAIDLDVMVIGIFTEALAGTNKLLLGASDSGVLGDTNKAATTGPSFNLDETPGRRRRSEQAYVQAASSGLRCGVLRLPLHVYGREESLTTLLDFVAKDGAARYIGEGSNEATVVHVEDVASAFVLALEKTFPPGTIFNVGDPSDVGITSKMIAEAVARRLSLTRVESMSFEDAVESWGFVLAWWYSLTNVMTVERTQTLLGWEVANGRSFLRDIVNG